jgi:hypothetical protein
MEVSHTGDLVVVNVGYRCFVSFGVRFIFSSSRYFPSSRLIHETRGFRTVLGFSNEAASQSCGMTSCQKDRKRAKLSTAQEITYFFLKPMMIREPRAIEEGSVNR